MTRILQMLDMIEDYKEALINKKCEVDAITAIKHCQNIIAENSQHSEWQKELLKEEDSLYYARRVRFVKIMNGRDEWETIKTTASDKDIGIQLLASVRNEKCGEFVSDPYFLLKHFGHTVEVVSCQYDSLDTTNALKVDAEFDSHKLYEDYIKKVNKAGKNDED